MTARRRVIGKRRVGGACLDMGICVGGRPANYVSICTGIAGLDSAIHATIPGVVPLVYMENEVTATARLAAYMAAQLIPSAPIWSDLRSFDGRALRGRVDLLVGGYPCQPYSHAGRGLGADDPRDLWPSVARLVGDMQPSLVFFENVSGHLSNGFERVGEDLQALGYRFTCALAEALDVAAPHHRLRLFILGWRRDLEDTGRMVAGRTDTTGESDQQDRESGQSKQSGGTDEPETLGDDRGGGMARRQHSMGRLGRETSSNEWNAQAGNTRGTNIEIPLWPLLPNDSTAWRGLLARYPLLSPAIPLTVFRRMADVQSGGDQPDVHLPCTCNRTDRIRLLGNAVCTDQAILALRHLWHEAFSWVQAECPHILTLGNGAR